MEIITDAQLLELIEQFLAETKMSPSRFGILTLKDSALVFQMRRGDRSLTLKSAGRIAAFMDEYRAGSA